MPAPRWAFRIWRTLNVVLILSLLQVSSGQYRQRIRPGQTPTYRRTQTTSRHRVGVPYNRRPQVQLRTEDNNAIRRMEDEMSKMKVLIDGMETRLRVTLSATLSQRLKTVDAEVKKNNDRIRKAEDSITRLEQQLGNLGSHSFGTDTGSQASRPVQLDLLTIRQSIARLEDKVTNATSGQHQNHVVASQLQTLQDEHTYLKGIAATTSSVSQKVSQLESRYEEQEQVINSLERRLIDVHESATVSEKIATLEHNLTILARQDAVTELQRLNDVKFHKLKDVVAELGDSVQQNADYIRVIESRNIAQDEGLGDCAKKLQAFDLLHRDLKRNMTSHVHREFSKNSDRIASAEKAIESNSATLLALKKQKDSITSNIQELNKTVGQIAAYSSEYEDFPSLIEEAVVGGGEYAPPRETPIQNSIAKASTLGSSPTNSDIEARIRNLESKATEQDASYAEVHRVVTTLGSKVELSELEARLTNLEAKSSQLDGFYADAYRGVDTDATVTQDKFKTRLEEKLNETMSVIETHQHSIQFIMLSLANASRKMENFTSAFALVRAAFNRVESRDTEHNVAIRANRRAVEALVTSVRDVTQDERRQSSAIGNLRRRIRNMEGIDMNKYVTVDEFQSAQHNLSVDMANLQWELAGLGDAPAVAYGQEESAEASSTMQKLTKELETTDYRVEQLAEAVAYLLNHTSQSGSLLESEFESYIRVIQTIPRIREDVNELIRMRNVVLKNSADVNHLHELYEKEQLDLAELKTKTVNLDFETKSLKRADENIHSNMEETLNLYRNLAGSLNDLRNDFTLVNYSLDINMTVMASDIKTLYDRVDEEQILGVDLETGLNNLDVSLKDFKRENEVKLAEQGLSMLHITKKLANIDSSLLRLSEDQSKSSTATEKSLSVLESANEDHNRKLQAVVEDLTGTKQEIESLQQTDMRGEAVLQNIRHKMEIFEREQTRQKDAVDFNSATMQSNKEIATDLQRRGEHYSRKMEDFEARLEGMHQSISQQTNTSSIADKIDLEIIARMSSMEQKVHDHEKFVQRAEEAISSHHVDIHTMLLQSSNHTIALRMLKERMKDDHAANITREILYEMSSLERSIQIVANDITTIKSKDEVQNMAVSRLQNNVAEMQSSVWGVESNIRQHTSLIESLQLDVESKATFQGTLSENLRTLQDSIRSVQQDILGHTNDITSLKDANNDANYASRIFENSLRATRNKTRELQSSISSLTYKTSVMNTDINRYKLALEDLDGRYTGQSSQLQEQQNAFYVMKADVQNTYSEVQLLKDTVNSFDRTRAKILSLNDRTKGMETSIANVEERNTINKRIITRIYSELNQTVVNCNRIISSLAEEKMRRFDLDQETSTAIQTLQTGVSQLGRNWAAAMKNFSDLPTKTDLLQLKVDEIEQSQAEHVYFTANALAEKVSAAAFNRTLTGLSHKLTLNDNSIGVLRSTYDKISRKVENNSASTRDVVQRVSQHVAESDGILKEIRQYVESRLQRQNTTVKKILRALIPTTWTVVEVDTDYSAPSGDFEDNYEFGSEAETNGKQDAFDDLQVHTV